MASEIAQWMIFQAAYKISSISRSIIPKRGTIIKVQRSLGDLKNGSDQGSNDKNLNLKFRIL